MTHPTYPVGQTIAFRGLQGMSRHSSPAQDEKSPTHPWGRRSLYSRLPGCGAGVFSTAPCRVAAAIFLLALTSCGYHLANSTSNLLPKGIHTIAIPAFANGTTSYKLTDDLTEAMTREFLSRTKYNVVQNPANADATFHGTITQVFTFPTVFDPVTFRATNVEVHVNVRFQLVDKAGKVLFDRPGMEIRERYEISTDPTKYFDENEFAMRRLSIDCAKTIVSAILENF